MREFLKTQGTRLFFANSPSEILQLPCITGISGLGGAASQIDTTCLTSEEDEFEQGRPSPGTVTIPVNLKDQAEAHQQLAELQDSGEVISWMIVMSNQAGDPSTLDTDDRLVSPGATTVEFKGYVSDFTIDIANNEIVRATLEIQRSGARNWTWPAPTS